MEEVTEAKDSGADACECSVGHEAVALDEQQQQQQTQPVVFSQSPRPQCLKHTFDRTRNNNIQILTSELRDWVMHCSGAISEIIGAAATSTPGADPGSEAVGDHAPNSGTTVHSKAEARFATCIVHVVKVINDAACAVEVDFSIATMTDCIFMLNDVVCVSEQSKLWEGQLPEQPNVLENAKFKPTMRDRLRNLRHALEGLQQRIENLLTVIVTQRTIAVCQRHLNARTYRVGVNESYMSSELPQGLETNILRPISDALRPVLPMVASKLLSMTLNDTLNAVLDYLLDERIMFNFSGVHRLHKDMEALKLWVIRIKQLWVCPAGQELLEDKSGWVRVNNALKVLAGEEQHSTKSSSKADQNRRSSRSSSQSDSGGLIQERSTPSPEHQGGFHERNQWLSLRRASWIQSLQFWKSSHNFRPRRNAGIVPSIELDYSEL